MSEIINISDLNITSYTIDSSDIEMRLHDDIVASSLTFNIGQEYSSSTTINFIIDNQSKYKIIVNDKDEIKANTRKTDLKSLSSILIDEVSGNGDIITLFISKNITTTFNGHSLYYSSTTKDSKGETSLDHDSDRLNSQTAGFYKYNSDELIPIVDSISLKPNKSISQSFYIADVVSNSIVDINNEIYILKDDKLINSNNVSFKLENNKVSINSEEYTLNNGYFVNTNNNKFEIKNNKVSIKQELDRIIINIPKGNYNNSTIYSLSGQLNESDLTITINQNKIPNNVVFELGLDNNLTLPLSECSVTCERDEAQLIYSNGKFKDHKFSDKLFEENDDIDISMDCELLNTYNIDSDIDLVSLQENNLLKTPIYHICLNRNFNKTDKGFNIYIPFISDGGMSKNYVVIERDTPDYMKNGKGVYNNLEKLPYDITIETVEENFGGGIGGSIIGGGNFKVINTYAKHKLLKDPCKLVFDKKYFSFKNTTLTPLYCFDLQGTLCFLDLYKSEIYSSSTLGTLEKVCDINNNQFILNGITFSFFYEIAKDDENNIISTEGEATISSERTDLNSDNSFTFIEKDGRNKYFWLKKGSEDYIIFAENFQDALVNNRIDINTKHYFISIRPSKINGVYEIYKEASYDNPSTPIQIGEKKVLLIKINDKPYVVDSDRVSTYDPSTQRFELNGKTYQIFEDRKIKLIINEIPEESGGSTLSNNNEFTFDGTTIYLLLPNNDIVVWFNGSITNSYDHVYDSKTDHEIFYAKNKSLKEWTDYYCSGTLFIQGERVPSENFIREIDNVSGVEKDVVKFSIKHISNGKFTILGDEYTISHTPKICKFNDDKEYEDITDLSTLALNNTFTFKLGDAKYKVANWKSIFDDLMLHKYNIAKLHDLSNGFLTVETSSTVNWLVYNYKAYEVNGVYHWLNERTNYMIPIDHLTKDKESFNLKFSIDKPLYTEDYADNLLVYNKSFSTYNKTQTFDRSVEPLKSDDDGYYKINEVLPFFVSQNLNLNLLNLSSFNISDLKEDDGKLFSDSITDYEYDTNNHLYYDGTSFFRIDSNNYLESIPFYNNCLVNYGYYLDSSNNLCWDTKNDEKTIKNIVNSYSLSSNTYSNFTLGDSNILGVTINTDDSSNGIVKHTAKFSPYNIINIKEFLPIRIEVQ